MIGAPIMIDGAPMTTDVLPSCEGEAAPAGARAVNLLIARNAYRKPHASTPTIGWWLRQGARVIEKTR
jgi:hypothetical protein